MAKQFDPDAIKDKLSILDLFKSDGHEVKKSGASYSCRCPFHDERTPSCNVDTSKQRFHCFGCGEGGDIIQYWMLSRSVDFKNALEQLSAVAGIEGTEYNFIPAKRKPTRRKLEPEKLPERLDSVSLDKWLQSCATLATTPSEITRIANWRGYQESTVKWAAETGLMGTFSYFGEPREAFLVEMPTSSEGTRIPVSVHVRLSPNTKGNDHAKQSWRFQPKGCGAWPFMIGNPATADFIFFTEGQWDSLALIDVMGWIDSPQVFDKIAVVGLRGSSSTDKFLNNYTINPKATAIAFADADNAGKKWFEPKGFLDLLREKVKRVYGFKPDKEGADLNDIIKDGMTRGHLMMFLKPKLTTRRTKVGPTFLQWCKNNAHREGLIGIGCKLVIDDPNRPKGRQGLHIWKRHWKKFAFTEEQTASLHIAWKEYKESL